MISYKQDNNLSTIIKGQSFKTFLCQKIIPFEVNRETLAAMEGRIEEIARLILPGMPLDVIAYGCTSASMVIGPSR